MTWTVRKAAGRFPYDVRRCTTKWQRQFRSKSNSKNQDIHPSTTYWQNYFAWIRLDVPLAIQVQGAKCCVELFSSYEPVEIKHLFTEPRGNPPLNTTSLNKLKTNYCSTSFKVLLWSILDTHVFTFSYTTGLSKISCQISIYYEQYNSCFLDLYFREFTAAINFPCSKSGWNCNNNWHRSCYRNNKRFGS